MKHFYFTCTKHFIVVDYQNRKSCMHVIQNIYCCIYWVISYCLPSKVISEWKGNIENNLSIEYGFPSGTLLMRILHIHLMIYSPECIVACQGSGVSSENHIWLTHILLSIWNVYSWTAEFEIHLGRSLIYTRNRIGPSTVRFGHLRLLARMWRFPLQNSTAWEIFGRKSAIQAWVQGSTPYQLFGINVLK